MRVHTIASIVLLAAGCNGGAAGAAIFNTAIAATASGVQRAGGGCYANCPPGTECNRATGLCDELPCRGQCGAGERCDRAGPIDRCVPVRPVDLQIDRPVVPAQATEPAGTPPAKP